MNKPSDEEMEWAVFQLGPLASLYGFPDTPTKMNGIAGAFLRIVCDQPRLEWETGPNQTAVREFVPREQTSDELISELLSSCERFPTPIKMRQIYERLGYACTDGKSYQDLGVDEK